MVHLLISVIVVENIGSKGILVKVLASLAIWAVADLEILFARLSFKSEVSDSFGLKLVLAMGKAALITEFAGSSELPIFAEFSFKFFLVFFNVMALFLDALESFSLGADIYLEVGLIIRVDMMVG